jgi:hypothetical protein
MTPDLDSNDGSLSEDEQRRVDAFLQLTRLERGLRRVLETELSRADGVKWERALPKDIREKIDGKGIDYADFPDLKKILGSSWNKIEHPVDGPSKAHATVHLEGLESVRNDLAHSRDVSSKDLSLIQAAYHVFLPLIPHCAAESSPSMPPTQHPLIALDRIAAAVSNGGSIARTDLATMAIDNELGAALADYARVRERPGRPPKLLADVKIKALRQIAEKRANLAQNEH